ncbi:Dinitrogenase iron-molybdenum cofactor biosynthesis protein [Spirochaeta thermophila DSM 6578]|uniref:Dinitrogenase iron-molybdenum cofactor biosynthesis protein n=1 Tax=Winmispira thermophila (strain ATCC 700085 / DSM 6578 / Z-1203) TaxID=869211 RepID=G0GAM1_WINT7|nr:NifB/NifX family molybdenum-iron cluster-binding protein [Spirochaeta thermophila]AEJ60986.1 Dinitrogenase iron-molybdenum cofactor biosynthesis protein [Spirochaeta thermophila DSM 6578]
MRIAVPLEKGKVSSHFGGSERFCIIEVDENGNERSYEEFVPPPHEPGAFPRWFAQQGVDVVITGGIGSRALAMFKRLGIEVRSCVPPEDPREVVRAYVEGRLPEAEEPCTDHHHHHHHHAHHHHEEE